MSVYFALGFFLPYCTHSSLKTHPIYRRMQCIANVNHYRKNSADANLRGVKMNKWGHIHISHFRTSKIAPTNEQENNYCVIPYSLMLSFLLQLL